MVQVPLVDLAATYRPIRRQLWDSFERIFETMHLFLGENVQALEAEFTAYCGAPYGLGCASGTDAITLPLKAFDFEPGFEAIIPSLTFFATLESVVHAGGVPVLVDIDPRTYTLDPARVEEALSAKTHVIIPVHLYGQCADLDPMLALARKRGLKVLEDAAQAHGASYKGRKAGTLGDAAGFSFYFTKNLGAFGEAGFVTSNDREHFERMKRYRHHGHVSKFEHDVVGYNMRLDELQAAVLRAKLPALERNNALRRQIARRYDEAFAPLGLVTPFIDPRGETNYHCYVIQADRRDELAHHLGECRIGVGIHYKNPVHRQPALRHIAHRTLPMLVTESVCARCLTLPCYPELSEEQITHVVRSVRAFFGA